MTAAAIGFWQLLLLSSRQLVELGVPVRDVPRRRFEMTGHVRALHPIWAPAFDCWGAVDDLDTIAMRTGKTASQVREHAKNAALRYATSKTRRSHAQLAILLWTDRARSPAESCKRFGVLAGQRRLLCAAAQELIDRQRGGIETVLGWDAPQLEKNFARLGVDLRPPPRLLDARRARSGELSVSGHVGLALLREGTPC